MSFVQSIKAAREVGRQNYEQAVSIFKRMLENNPNDKYSLSMIAFCYEWAGDLENAILYAEKLLTIEPDDFQMLALAARYWSKKDNIEQTYQYAHRMASNPPEVLPEVPSFVKKTFKAISSLPIINNANKNDPFEDLQINEKKDQDLLCWAKEYVKWYEEVRMNNPQSNIQ